MHIKARYYIFVENYKSLRRIRKYMTTESFVTMFYNVVFHTYQGLNVTDVPFSFW